MNKLFLYSILLFCVLIGGPKALAGDHLEQMTVAHCTSKLCVKIQAIKGYQSPLDTDVTSFDQGTLELQLQQETSSPLKDDVKTTMAFSEGYIDLESHILVAKGLKNSPHQDALIHLNSGEIQYF